MEVKSVPQIDLSVTPFSVHILQINLSPVTGLVGCVCLMVLQCPLTIALLHTAFHIYYIIGSIERLFPGVSLDLFPEKPEFILGLFFAVFFEYFLDAFV